MSCYSLTSRFISAKRTYDVVRPSRDEDRGEDGNDGNNGVDTARENADCDAVEEDLYKPYLMMRIVWRSKNSDVPRDGEDGESRFLRGEIKR